MKKFQHLLVIVIIVLLITNCKSKEGYEILGHIDNIEDGTLITLYDFEQQVTLDSVFSVDGNFTFTGKVEYPTAYWIRCKGETATIQVENVKIKFTSPIKEMQRRSKIVGGEEQRLQNEVNSLLYPYDSIRRVCFDILWNKKYSDEIEKQIINEKYKDAISTYDKLYLNFGKENLNSFYGLKIVYVSKNSIPKDTLKLIYESLAPKFRDSPDGLGMKYFLTEKLAQKGEQFIDFTAKTFDGKDFRLSSLKGNYIYLTFWSAGCDPCRQENKYLSRNFKDIPKELSIVSFSLDKSRDYWEISTKEDSIIWHNVTSLDTELGKVKNIYNISAMPTAFLIDPSGVIINKFIGFDTDEVLIGQLKKIMAQRE